MSTARELERLAGERPDADALYERLLALLARDGLRFDGACWHVCDPLTGLFARTGAVGDLPGDYRTAVELELFAGDVAKMDEVAGRAVPVATLVAETGGRPQTSARWREMIRPDGQSPGGSPWSRNPRRAPASSTCACARRASASASARSPWP